jgi:hypothetical protein
VVDGEARRLGVGGMLVDDFLQLAERAHPGRQISVVTSPRNVAMIALLLGRGFTVTWAVRGYFGGDKDRFYLQYDVSLPEYDASQATVVPAAAAETVFSLLEQRSVVITRVLGGAQGPFFDVVRLDTEDRAALRANEASISVSESGAVVAGFTFILGLSFVIPDFSESLRVVLLLATVATTGALAIFANSSGNLARIRDNSFDRHMKWANLLLEFGGLYPLVISLTAVFVRADDRSFWISFSISLVVSAILAAYEYSPFSLSYRYRATWYLHVGVIATVLLPAAYAPLTLVTRGETVWTIVVAVVLVGRCTMHLVKGNAESRRRRRVRSRAARSRR